MVKNLYMKFLCIAWSTGAILARPKKCAIVYTRYIAKYTNSEGFKMFHCKFLHEVA